MPVAYPEIRNGNGPAGAPVGDGVAATACDQAHQPMELGRLQADERVDQLGTGG